jgi:ribonuclease J
MRIRIHRGAHEVGGNCVEVEAADGTRIALDLGRPLTARPKDSVTVPTFDGTLSAVFISHPHLDHYGLVVGLDPTSPSTSALRRSESSTPRRSSRR